MLRAMLRPWAEPRLTLSGNERPAALVHRSLLCCDCVAGGRDGIATRTRSKAPVLCRYAVADWCPILTVSLAITPLVPINSLKRMPSTPCVSIPARCSLMGSVDIKGSPSLPAPGAATIAAGFCRAAFCYLQPPRVSGSSASSPAPSPSSSSSSSGRSSSRLRCSYGLSLLSTELVLHILSLAAPSLRQCITLGPGGHPDVLPALLPSDPATWGPPPPPQAPPAPA